MRTAIVTSSYRGDIERCRLLCESIDRHVRGHARHVILVEDRDLAIFADLAGPRREVIGEGDLLPFWLKPFPDPTCLGRRRIWLSPKGPPLRGWHVQQLRRIAMALRLPEEVMLSCDSDIVFVKPFDVASMMEGGAVRFHRVSGAAAEILPEFRKDHRRWSRRAGQLLGIPSPEETQVGYIATAIAWRTDTVRAMAGRIAEVAGRSWISALSATRELSECTIYGRFVDEVERRPERHLPRPDPICRIYWSGAAMAEKEIDDLLASLAPTEVALGIQSFTGTDIGLIRRAAGLGRRSAS